MEKQFFARPAVYVGEVHIKVKHMERAIHFYRSVLGFRVMKQDHHEVVLTADGRTPLLTLHEPQGVAEKENRTTGLYHFAILLPNRSDFAAFLRHILQSGQQLGAADHLVSEALYFSDPDGNGIEVYHDRPSNLWQWENRQVSMTTDPLDANDILAEPDIAWQGLPEHTLMGHIHLHVSDLEEAEAFYVQGLGFRIATTYPGALFLSTADYHHHIGLNVWNGNGAKKPSAKSVGLEWFSLIFPDKTSRDLAVDRLQAQHVTTVWMGSDVVVEDPAGNRIHLKASE